MTRCIAFHSYKGGTGKTTIACNLAAMLAAKGHRVSLLDFDVYAPSMQSYFDHAPRKWINDLLSDEAAVDEVMLDATDLVRASAKDSMNDSGKLWIGFSNSKKEEIYRLDESGKQNGKLRILR